jgi:tRNA (uracil-5-)-methyltransferase TRM9
MNSNTTQKIVDLNLDFYERIGPLWNQGANYSWDGWEEVLKVINNKFSNQKQLKILDLGAGNCRFLNYLASEVSFDLDYTGIDFSDSMLNLSEINKSNKIINIKILKKDLLKESWAIDLDLNSFDLVVAFGLFHHIPGFQNRLNIFQRIKDLLVKEGIYVFTTWQFLDVPRLQKRIAWPNDLDDDFILKRLEISKSDLEQGDYFLDWVKKEIGYRYAHAFSDQEIMDLTKGLELIKDYRSDGRNMNRNRYLIFQN